MHNLAGITRNEMEAAYIERVNQAVAEGRDDLVASLSDDYLEEALAAMVAAEAARH